MSLESNESELFFLGGTVQKIHKDKELAAREADFLERYKSPYFVVVIRRLEGGIEMGYAGLPLGDNARDENGEYVFEKALVKVAGVDKLRRWLEGLREELKRLGVSHGDICPPNILWNPIMREFKLIDFTYAKEGEYPKGGDRWQAPYNDEEYIQILLDQL